VLFAHGHLLRVLAARWLGFPASAGRHFLLGTGTLNILSYYHGVPAIQAMELGGRIVAALLSAEIRQKQGRIRTPWPAGN